LAAIVRGGGATNVLLISIDTLRAIGSAVCATDGRRRRPSTRSARAASLHARGDGPPLTLPAHTSLLTAPFPLSLHGGARQRAVSTSATDQITLAEVLKAMNSPARASLQSHRERVIRTSASRFPAALPRVIALGGEAVLGRARIRRKYVSKSLRNCPPAIE